MKKALLLVDIQNDFLPGGALAVPGGDRIIPLVNQIKQHFHHVLATQDWHPLNHGSFETHNHLHEHKITDIYIVGLATDYCVRYSAIDAVLLGFKTHVIADACRAVNLKPDDDMRAFAEMREAGAHVIESAGLPGHFAAKAP